MNRYFALPMLFFVRCVIVFFGTVLISSDAQFFQNGDKVVAQNTLTGLSVYTDGPDKGEPNPDKISDGSKGTFQSAIEINGKFWFKVDWDIGVDGWSQVNQNGCDLIGTAASADRRDKIAAVLFSRVPHQDTNHEYNGYGCNEHLAIYDGGHSGWDVQTHKAAGPATEDQPFYSLTAGEVIAAERGNLNKTAVIAVGASCARDTFAKMLKKIEN